MAAAQLYFEDVEVGDPVRPMFAYVEQMQLVEWGAVTGNTDAGHWHIFHNRWKHTGDPSVSQLAGHDPSITGQFKTAMMDRMLMEWGGPRTLVKKLHVQYRVWDHFFELKTFKGTVTGKRVENGEGVVEVELTMAREDGRITTPATATVLFPIRKKQNENTHS